MDFTWLVFLGGAVDLIGCFSYITDTLKGRNKPNRVTWFLWFATHLIATIAALAGGAGWAALPIFMAGVVPLLVFLASFVNPKAYWKLEKFDYLCGFFSLVALVLWLVTRDPALAVLFAIIADGFAATPTIVKAWRHPKTESPLVYATGLFNSLTAFAVITGWRFSTYAFPVYLVVVHIILLWASLRIQRKK